MTLRERIARRFKPAVLDKGFDPAALRVGGLDASGVPMLVGSTRPDAVGDQSRRLPGIFVRLTDEVEPWGPDGAPLTAKGNPLRDPSGRPLV